MSRLSGRLTLIAVGKLRQKAWLAAQAEYMKRLQRYYAGFDLVEVKDFVGRGAPDAVAMQREGDLLLKAAAPAGRRIALDVTGTQLDSPALAAFVQKRVETYGSLAFLIGGPVGLAPDVLTRCEDSLSLSPLTFPHELARILLLEQLYRAATLLSGEKYHK
ncbi:MAG: 23S rRNA (pseudouridine(1915)-N(3))-methyltransferase RlmH [Anaerolineae bacterium]|nr:23S rRNA (pseudouridine(1915)-N(3))-methyltransferase RlmH [Anaerolineae bacterium]